jgi:hypothetical protein
MGRFLTALGQEIAVTSSFIMTQPARIFLEPFSQELVGRCISSTTLYFMEEVQEGCWIRPFPSHPPGGS